jgi:hypothetical protein
MASQTLLSSKMRTRQGEDFLFGQASLAWQAVKGGQHAVQLAFLGKEIVEKPRRLRLGKLADGINHFGRGHAQKVLDAARRSSLNLGNINPKFKTSMKSKMRKRPITPALYGLTPGTTYSLQVRAVGGSTGYSDWSDAVSHMSL